MAYCNENWGGQFGSAVKDGTPLECFKYRSLSGFLMCRSGGPIAWKSIRQNQTDLSSCEEEINYHFHLGLLSADEPPDPHYENPPQVFQSSQQNLTTEGHHPSHYIFYQILLRRIWKIPNQEVHIRHLPHLIS